MGVHGKEMKLKEVARHWELYTILTKERGVGLQETINCGEVPRKYMGELMEDKGYFSKVCLCRFISVSTFHL